MREKRREAGMRGLRVVVRGMMRGAICGAVEA